MAALSASDMEALRHGFQKSIGMTFNERTAATHGPDWQAADLGVMKYEDMIEDSPSRDEVIAYLKENASHIRI
jgi:hypothetical protein